MKLRYLPWKRQKGCRALTTPAPRVQRLPAPPAKASTATSPPAKAASPARWSAGFQRPSAIVSNTSPQATSSMTVLGGRRFWARPIRPVRRSERICSCSSGSNPLASRIDFRLPLPSASSLGPREQGPQQHLGGTGQPRMRAAGGGKPRDLVAHRRAELPRFLPQPLAARRSHSRPRASSRRRPRTARPAVPRSLMAKS